MATKNILISLVGTTPQVVTETIWQLKEERNIKISKVFIITTMLGKNIIFKGDTNRNIPSLKDKLIEMQKYGYDIGLGEDDIFVIKTLAGKEVEDLSTKEENELAANFILDTTRKIMSQYEDSSIYMSIAGGRKSMSALAAITMTLLGRQKDHILHVLVSPEEIEKKGYFYPPEDPEKKMKISLFEVPFICLGEKYNNLIRDTDTFIDVVNSIKNCFVLDESASEDDYVTLTESNSRAIKDILIKLENIAREGIARSILFVGESGTGKELFAKYFFSLYKKYNKDRHNIPYNTIVISNYENNEDILNSELFGHKKGAFTDALKDREGLIELSNNGILFIDEIGKANELIQNKLLRVVEYKKFRPVGSNTEQDADVFFIFAMREDPETKLIEDLRNRINITFVVPPLRDRKEDLKMLIKHFAKKIYKSLLEKGKIPPEQKLEVSFDAIYNSLYEYDWPGNVRELKKTIENMFSFRDENEMKLTKLPQDFIEKLKHQVESKKRVKLDEKSDLLEKLEALFGYKIDLDKGIRLKEIRDDFQKLLCTWIYNNYKDDGNLNLYDIAKSVGVSPNTFRKYIKKGKK